MGSIDQSKQEVQNITPKQALQNLAIFVERGIIKGGLFTGMQEAIAAHESINVLAAIVNPKQ